MPDQIKITFEPTGRTVHVLPETLLTEAATRAGLPIDTPCGGAGTCGKCKVRFVSGPPAASAHAGEHLDEAELSAGWRLACQARLSTDAVVSIPQTALFDDRLQILTRSTAIEEDSRGIPPHERVPTPLREGQSNFGLAVDIGTTTVVAELIELPSGRQCAIEADINPQVSFGDDVVSRIGRACESPADAAEMTGAIRATVGELAGRAAAEAGIDRSDICSIAMAGNTTMQHLLCGLDVTSLSALPFAPARREPTETTAAELEIALRDDARAYVFPVIGGFVGGDTVAGILSAGMDQTDEPTLMIDIGTNGEIVLAAGGKLLAASAAAGPAFEGARIANGMRAANGAIEKVIFDADHNGGDVYCSVIGGVEPIGICGSALVDVAAELLRCGVMTREGRLLPAEECGAVTCRGLVERIGKNGDGQVAFALAPPADGRDGVAITQKDIRELQLATGALRAGVEILLKQAGLEPADLGRVLIAGGFGSFIRRDNAQRIGLIPHEVDARRISYVGNVSLHGAKWALLSKVARERIEEIRSRAEHVELSADMDFQMAFAEAMIFPAG